MILIAALAPGLARAPSEFMLIAFSVRELPPSDQWNGAWLRDVAAGRSWAATTLAWEILNLVIPFLLVLPPAQLLFRLRRPRPPIEKAVFHPGTAASTAVVLSFLVLFELSALGFLPPSPLIMQAVGGVSVALAWVALALSGRWQRVPGWIDRTGRVVGAAWVATASLVIMSWIAGQ